MLPSKVWPFSVRWQEVFYRCWRDHSGLRVAAHGHLVSCDQRSTCQSSADECKWLFPVPSFQTTLHKPWAGWVLQQCKVTKVIRNPQFLHLLSKNSSSRRHLAKMRTTYRLVVEVRNGKRKVQDQVSWYQRSHFRSSHTSENSTSPIDFLIKNALVTFWKDGIPLKALATEILC